jgi:hypothetical protein
MILLTIITYLVSIFLILFGLRSFIAGLKNEKKSFWFIISYSKGLKNLLKEKYDRTLNFVGGIISVIVGLIVLLTLILRGV